MKQLTLLILAFAITTTTFVNDAEARRSRRQSRSQQQQANAFAQAEAQIAQAQAIPPSPHTNVCEVFINFSAYPGMVVSGLTSLSQQECNNLNLDSGGVPFFRNDPVYDLITPRFYDGFQIIALAIYSGNYLGISLNSAYEVVNISSTLYSNSPFAAVYVARGVWRQ